MFRQSITNWKWRIQIARAIPVHTIGLRSMWVLSTDRAELCHFASPEAVPGGYAILSHVWGREEQTFQDVQRIQHEANFAGKYYHLLLHRLS